MENLIQSVSLKLKLLRKTKGWSLDIASQKTGVSKAMLGQMERGESIPTIATLWKIADGFDEPFSSFFALSKPIYGNLNTIHLKNDGVSVVSIFPYNKEFGFESFIIDLLPNCEHLSTPHQKGVTEHILVFRGELDVLINGVWHKLKENEGLYFDANQSHGYKNLSNQKTVFFNMLHYRNS